MPTVRRFHRPIPYALAALLIALAAAGACRSTPAPVALSSEWPAKADSYDSAHRSWTRHGVVRRDYQEVLKVHATFKSPAWRSAYVQRKAQRSKLSAVQQQALQTAQQQAATGDYEVHLLVTTWDRRENDLHRGQKSVWTLTLADDQGNEIAPASVRRDRRTRWVIRAEYPDMGDFTEAYIARFPRTTELLRADADNFSLRVSGARGAVELVWKNHRSGQ